MIWHLTQIGNEKNPYYFYVNVMAYKGSMVNSSGSRKVVFKVDIIGMSPAVVNQAVNAEIMNRFNGKLFDSGVINTHMYSKHMVKSSEEAVINVMATLYNMTAKVYKDTSNETR